MADTRYAMNRVPWEIDTSLFILQSWEPEKTLKEMFKYENFWVQVWHLAPQLVNSENALDIVNDFFARIVSTENFTFMDEIGLPVIRMKVKVDLSKPLPRGFYIGEDTD